MKITGVIVQGKQLGRTLGFPTANLQPDVPSSCENGVYAAVLLLEGEAAPRPCMVNQGRHPTLPEGPPTIEANILDFDGDLYGRRADIEYLKFLRPEMRFPSVEALREQLCRDREATRSYFREHPVRMP